MRSSLIKFAVLGALGLASIQANAAAPFVDLPAAGTAVAAGTNQPAGTTGYKRFYNHASTNFGSQLVDPAYVYSATDTVNLGDTTSASALVAPTPYTSGYTQTASVTGAVVVNNVYSGGPITIGNYTSRVWRNPTLGQCVYGFQITNTLTDYLPLAGLQYIEFNDIAMGGFTGRAVDAAYWKHIGTSSVVYRAGLTFSAVQHRGANLAVSTGYVQLPINSPAFTGSINGLDAAPGGTPTAAQQTASINDNWVDFTLDVNAKDDDGSTSASSPWLYVHSTCAATGTLVSSPNAVRVRQSYQENAVNGGANRFTEIALPGFTPANNGVAVTPAPVAPF